MATAAARRYEALDSLRGVCALCVSLLHFKALGYIHNNSFIGESWIFVDFFFVLSGFVIAASYREKLASGFSIARFLGLRLGRLYPLHLAILMLMVGFQLALFIGQSMHLGDLQALKPAFTDPFGPRQLWEQLTFTNIIIFDQGIGWNDPSWSISAEFWTYTVAALVFVIARKQPNIAALAVTLASAAILATSGDGNLLRIDQFALLRCFYGFFLGTLTFSAIAAFKLWRLRNGLQTALQVVAVAISIAFIANVGKGPATLFAPPLFASVILVFSTDSGMIGRALCRPFPRLLGRLSYGIYLVHFFLIILAYQAFAMIEKALGVTLLSTLPGSGKLFGTSALSGDLLSVVFVAVVIGAAWVLNVTVENPARLWSRRMLATSAPVQPQQAMIAER